MKLSRTTCTVLLSLHFAVLALPTSPDDQIDIAIHLSGIYKPFNMENILSKISVMASLFKSTATVQEEESYVSFGNIGTSVHQECPDAINLKVQHAGNKLAIPLPGGLRTAKVKRCPATGVIVGDHESRNISLEKSMRTQLSTDSRDENFFEASLPKGVLQCRDETEEPFSSITIASLKSRLIPVLRSTFTELGIPEHVLQDILGVTLAPLGIDVYTLSSTLPTNRWESDYYVKSKQRMRDALQVLGKVNVLVVGRQQIFKQELPVDESIHIHSEDNLREAHRLLVDKSQECAYLGGDAFEHEEAYNALGKAITSLVPLFASTVPSSIPFSFQAFFPTDAKYNRSQSSTKISSISFKEAENSLLHAQGEEIQWFSVILNGQECTVVKLFPLLESQQSLIETNSALNTITHARKLVSFLESMGSLGIEHPIADSSHRYRFSAIANWARDILIKSSMYVGHINVAECYHIEDRQPIDVIFVQHPAPFFYCNRFPGLAQNISYPCSLRSSTRVLHHVQEGSSTQTQKSGNNTSVFLIPTARGEAHLYGSSADTAAILRNDKITPVSSTPEFLEPILPLEEPLSSQSPLVSTEPALVLEEDLSSSPEPFSIPLALEEPQRKERGKRACFPADALVLRSDGRTIAMREVQLGDEVLVGPGVFSAVVLFSHSDQEAVSDMVRIESNTGHIAASEGHFLFVNGNMVPAGKVHVGDSIFVANSSAMVKQRVKKVVRESLRGIYNPQTKEGTIFVSYGKGAAVLASTYTTALYPYAAHAAITPLRLLHGTFVAVIPAVSIAFPGTHIGRRRKRLQLTAKKVSEVRRTKSRKPRKNFFFAGNAAKTSLVFGIC